VALNGANHFGHWQVSFFPVFGQFDLRKLVAIAPAKNYA
jgi:hypothetical protein